MPAKGTRIGKLLEEPLVKRMSQLFDRLPDTCFFVKNDRSEFVHVNRALLHRLGLTRPSQIVGTTDHDRYPKPIADLLVKGDRQLMGSGEGLIDHAEVLFDEAGRLEWYSTTKYPVIDAAGRALGVVGITRSYSGRNPFNPGLSAAERVIETISKDPAGHHRVATLAREVGISERQLHRQFLQLVKMSPREFILRSRIQAAAADLRNSAESIASLADKYGFCDQSAFTRQFRSVLGMTPGQYRRTV
ncbi:MAG: AraC family transcriptional regulator [Verrucomicrobiales bacterium]|jgi:AraC-like DNA-binding protein|nr:AraC family transcriptional regulator [bacterium]MDF2377223.1 AraC family transcriptional regulator [Verrucomicrobiales bacterium]